MTMDMSTKKKRTAAAQAARGPLPTAPDELLDELVKRPMSAGQVQDLMLTFNKAIVERAMKAEMNLHLGYSRESRSRPSRTTSATAPAARRC